MKTITIKILTSISEIKEYFKERASKRYKHNKKCFSDFAKEVSNEIGSGYWSNDISEYMRKTLTNPYSGKLNEIYRKYLSKLK